MVPTTQYAIKNEFKIFIIKLIIYYLTSTIKDGSYQTAKVANPAFLNVWYQVFVLKNYKKNIIYLLITMFTYKCQLATRNSKHLHLLRDKDFYP